MTDVYLMNNENVEIIKAVIYISSAYKDRALILSGQLPLYLTIIFNIRNTTGAVL